MGERTSPKIYSIAAHRGFADALVAGLVPRYGDTDLGLAKLTLLMPSTRAVRTVTEAFIRHYGVNGQQGMLMPRMAVVGDLDLDETLGALLDPLAVGDIPVAVDPTRRWLRLARLLSEEMGDEAPGSATLLRLAKDIAATMDRLLVEDIGPEMLVEDDVIDLLGELSHHWIGALRLFVGVQDRWLSELSEMGAIDAAARRNRLFDHAAHCWKHKPPETPIVAVGVTSAAPALARLLRVVSELPNGAVVLPDFDLSMDDAVWEELGSAGGADNPRSPPFKRGDAITHPQYHLKLLLNRMGVARGEVQPWHRKGMTAASPDRTHAISSLFLPPEASKSWVDLHADKRRLSGVRWMESSSPEEEAQAIALLIREAVTIPEKRVAVVTPDRSLARRIVHHLRRWNLQADDSAGQPLSQTPAGRLLLLLAEVAAERAAPVSLMAMLQHPLVRFGENRGSWLRNARAFELKLRGPREAPGLAPLRIKADEAHVGDWWACVEEICAPLLDDNMPTDLAALLERLIVAGEALCGDALWSREDGRALSVLVDDLRIHAAEVSMSLDIEELHIVLRDAMDAVAVRPSYGGHPRVAIYGLLESRMSRADLVICAGLNEGSWPATPSTDPLLAPPILRALGVPGADFRIGLSAHDLAGALGAPEVVLSRAQRDIAGPTIPSRFLLRVKALLGADLIDRHRETEAIALAKAIDDARLAPLYPVPQPMPSATQRKQRISVTALDRLRSDPYQFYASTILGLGELEALDAEPSAAWRGIAAHEILERWHRSDCSMKEVAEEVLRKMNAHPLMRALWQPRLMKALDWVESTIGELNGRTPVVFEEWGEFDARGVTIFGKVDRVDKLENGELAIVDYKTGGPPSGRQVEQGYALQLGTLGLMAEQGAFKGVSGAAAKFEYWSLAKSEKSTTGFGFVATPLKEGNKRSGIASEDFLPQARDYLEDALDRWILGDEPFTARLNPDAAVYATFDQLMRLDEWMGRGS